MTSIDTTPERVLGPRITRSDAPVKATGAARYTADLVLPGMLHGRLVLAGRNHARLTRLDVGPARRSPGVRAVLTQADVPDVRYGMAVRDRTLFARDVVRYEGEIVAAVAATTPELAAAAADRVDVGYAPLPPVLDPERALADDAPLVHPDWASYALDRPDTRQGNDCARVTLERGDPEAAFADAAHVVAQRFVTDMSHPLAIEPHAVLADWADDRVTIWSTTQVPFLARTGVATTLGVPESRVRVVVTHLGGGFGGKCDFHLEAHAAALSRAARRPVRLVLTRREEFVVPDLTRHPMRIDLRTALDRDGTILARTARLLLDTGAYASHGPIASELATLMAAGPYRIPHLAIEARTVYTNRTPAGSTRAPTAPQTCWAVEQHTDALAQAVGLDPLAFRRRNLVDDGDVAATGQRLDRPTARACLDRAAELIAERDGARPRPDGWLEGVGHAVGWWGNVPLPSGAAARLEPDGSATLVSGAQDNGSGAAVALAPLVAEQLGLPIARVSIVHQDTAATPFDFGSLGSQTTFNAGRAALAAARALRAQVLEEAAGRLGAPGGALDLSGGAAYVVADPDRRVALTALAAGALADGRLLLAQAAPPPPARPPAPDADRSLGRTMYASFPFPSYYCCAARVAVDPETGRVQVLQVVAGHDIGRVLNPVGAEGQVEGGVVHSVGMALSEGVVLRDGYQRSTRLRDYRLPTAVDAPPVRISFLEPRSPGAGPGGSRGVGEVGVIAAAGAVANAIAAATGARVHRLPMAPHRVWAAIQEAA